MQVIPKFYQRVRCADGESVSIQANRGMYCKPRADDGPYTHVEAGYPSVAPPQSWMEFIDGADGDPCETVYGYVPVAIVNEFIDAHGGMVAGGLPPFAKAEGAQ